MIMYYYIGLLHILGREPEGAQAIMLATATKTLLIAKFVVCTARFANFEGILGVSVPSIILANLLGNTCLLVIGAFRSTLFVSLFQGSLLVITQFRTVLDLDQLVL